MHGTVGASDGEGIGATLDEGELLHGSDVGNVAPVYADDDVVVPQTVAVSLALFADKADNRTTADGNDRELCLLVTDCQLIILGSGRLEQHTFLKGIDDEVAVGQQLGTDV